MEFLYRGIAEFDEPGVLMTFEESPLDVAQNMHSLGFDVQSMVSSRKMVMDCVVLDPEEVLEGGSFNLEGLFIRLGQAIDSIGAKRVVLDTIDSLFSCLPNPARIRSELHRLFRWLKDKGVTAIVTGESGMDTYTRDGLEEYVSDCVILLTVSVSDRMASRFLRIIKYRGSDHGKNEYPFVIDGRGIALFPITAEGLDWQASQDRISSGVKKLDQMLGGAGFYQGSTVLVSGSAGTGKSTFLASFINAACLRKERAIYISFEESPSQIVRNMNSIGIRFEQHLEQGLLRIESYRCTQCDLEQHLLNIHRVIEEFLPRAVVIDPITSLSDISSHLFIKSLMLGSLTPSGATPEGTSASISSLIDSWIFLREIEGDGEFNRALVIRKSRGMNHSNKVREFKITDDGIDICEVIYGATGVLTGRARQLQSAEIVRELNQSKIDAS
ncbi:MAG: circadian clock protein KaiC [Betaproteobacteria bacterium]|nr:circadian clock protein KaiC [Betaproteobacteria bacterium]